MDQEAKDYADSIEHIIREVITADTISARHDPEKRRTTIELPHFLESEGIDTRYSKLGFQLLRFLSAGGRIVLDYDQTTEDEQWRARSRTPYAVNQPPSG